MAWRDNNKIAFAPEKLEIIHLIRKSGNYTPSYIINNELIIDPIITAPKDRDQPALYWLGVWFDRKLIFKYYIYKRVVKARKVSYYIRRLEKIQNSPPASSFCKAVITYILPLILYSTEAWYTDRIK
jgi:hypothetical protein